jgi:hypothetical protein
MTEEIKADAQRVWPNAKRIDVTAGSEGATVTAFDHDDHVIEQASAGTLEELKAKLGGMLPDGGQAP